MRIVKVVAREIFDSRGFPTVECDLFLKDGRMVRASVPSGASRGKLEAVELRDKDRLMEKGVMQAVANIEQKIAPLIIGQVPNVVQFDMEMLEMDGTENKSQLGANAMLAVSIAVCKAQALVEDMELYELIAFLCGFDSVTIPGPLFNIINGGIHANNKLHVQEFMVMPIGCQSFRQALEIGIMVFHTLKKLLRDEGKSIAVGDEGGFAPDFENESEAFDFLISAINNVKPFYDGTIMIALDIAASQLYNAKSKLYTLYDKQYDSNEMIEWYAQMVQKYPIYSIEDPLAEDDWDGWKSLHAHLADKVQLVGDDIFVTNPQRIWLGIEENIAQAMLIKPNQVGTVTEMLQAVKLCKEYERKVIVSHRSGETNDAFIADVAVGVSADQLKAGGCSRGERMAKYNRLLRIEDELMLSSLDFEFDLS